MLENLIALIFNYIVCMLGGEDSKYWDPIIYSHIQKKQEKNS